MIKPTRSAFYRRLYGVITRNPAPAPAPAPAATRPVGSVAADSVRKDISDEERRRKHINRLRLKFFFTKELFKFRARWGMKEETFRRMTQADRHHWMEQIVEELRKYGDTSQKVFEIYYMKRLGDSGKFEEMFETVEKWFEYVRRYPSDPNIKSVSYYHELMKVYCEVGFFNSAVKLLDEMETKGFVPDLDTYNILLDGLYVNGKLEDGDRIWERMVGKEVSPDLKSYIAKLIGLASTKRTKEAVELLDEMKTIKPDVESFRVLIKGFINEGNLEELKRVYGVIREAWFRFDDIRYSRLAYLTLEKAMGFVPVLRRSLLPGENKRRFLGTELQNEDEEL